MGSSSLDKAKLAAALQRLGILTALFEVGAKRLTGGASMETYRLELPNRKVCLRRTPSGSEGKPGQLGLGSPVGLENEAVLMQLVARAGVPVPAVLGVLMPTDGLGRGFFMSWQEGETLGSRIARSERFASLRADGALARQCGEVLARIHQCDMSTMSPELSSAMLATDALSECRRWHETYMAVTAGSRRPALEYAFRWLRENLPRSTNRKALVHGDFRNGNLMVSPESGIVGVLDWELAHLGDPTEDLGWLCVNSWRFGQRDQRVGGFGTVEALVEGYESVAGQGAIDLEALSWWEAFGSVKWSVICLGMGEAWMVAETISHSSDSVRTNPVSMERLAIAKRSSEAELDVLALVLPPAVAVVVPLRDAPSENGYPNRTASAAVLNVMEPLKLEYAIVATSPMTSVDNEPPSSLINSALRGLRQLLSDDLLPALKVGDTKSSARLAYLSRVGVGLADTALRDLEFGSTTRSSERDRLRILLSGMKVGSHRPGSEPSGHSLQWLRDNLGEQLHSSQPSAARGMLASPSLQRHLWITALDTIAIEQPTFSTFRAAL